MHNPRKIESEILQLIGDRNNGSKLARFEDWAALHSPEEVEQALRFLGRHYGSLTEAEEHD